MMQRMRPLALVTLLVLVAAPAAAAPPGVVALDARDFLYAEWLADGSGFYVVTTERLQRYDAAGRRRGPAIALHLPDDAVLSAPPGAHRGLSADGKRLALLVMVPGRPEARLWIAELPDGKARDAGVGGLVLSYEWRGDGALVGARNPGRRFVVDAAGKVASLCPFSPYFAVHVHPDGRRLVLGINQVDIVDDACRTQEAFAPWPEGASARTWISDFGFSPSGQHLAMIAGVALDQPSRLWVQSIDRKENIDTSCVPEPGALHWLDENTLVVLVENGESGTSQRRLERVDWRTGHRRPLVPSKPTCNDENASASPRGGAIVFQRLCDDPADSFVGLVRAR